MKAKTRTITVLAIALGVFLGAAYPSAALAAGACPNDEIRVEQESTHLPGCMAYELISPADTLGSGDISFFSGTSDGNHAEVGSVIPISSSQSTGDALALAARRTQTGWLLDDLGELSNQNKAYYSQGYPENGTHFLVLACHASLLGCRPGPFAFERTDESGAKTTMLSGQLPEGGGFGEPAIVGISDNASRVFIDNDELPPFLPEDTHMLGRGLYASHDGALEYLGFDENGDVLPCGAVLGAGDRDGVGFEQTGASSDGRTVAFESPDPQAGCSEAIDVYVRRDGQSINISRPRNGNANKGATFVGASRDGDITYFATASQLVASDSDSETDIYSYELASDVQNLITGGVGVAASGEPQAAVSPGGDYVYFNSLNAYNGEGVDGLPNLYVYHAANIRFIATAEEGLFQNGASVGGDVSAITPDGTHIIVNSDDPLTSGQPTGGRQQILQYSYDDDTMVCVSCPPDGSVPTQPTTLDNHPGPSRSWRHQSDDGDAVAFSSEAALVEDDSNDKVSDVYLWRRGAPLALISSGRGEARAQFAGMGADGHSVFFLTGAALVPGIQAGNVRGYVARVDGGFAPPAVPTPCTGEACRAGGTVPPLGVTTSTSTFIGPPNPKPNRRKKAKQRKKKAHSKKAHRRDAGHNRGGSK